MTRNLIVALTLAALLLAGGAALAKSFACEGGKCVGTERADGLAGSTGKDKIVGRGGPDAITGDPFNEPAGDNVIRGGAGAGLILDILGANEDTISVAEEARSEDFVDCGPGKDDVAVDESNPVKNYEIVDRI